MSLSPCRCDVTSVDLLFVVRRNSVQTILTGTRDDCFKADVEDRSRYVILTGGTGTSVRISPVAFRTFRQLTLFLAQQGIPVTFCFPSAAKSSSQSEVSTTAAASIVELRFWRVKNIKTRKGNNSWTYFDDEDTPFFTLEFECRATGASFVSHLFKCCLADSFRLIAASLAKKMPPVNKPSAPLVAGRFRQHTPARTRSAAARSPSTPFTSLFANTPPSPRAASPVSSARTSIAVRATPAVASTSKAAATTSAATIIDLTESSPDPPPPQPVPPSLTPAVAHTQQKLSKRDPDVEAAEKELKRLRREARMEQLEDFIAAKKGGDYDEMPSDGARVKLE